MDIDVQKAKKSRIRISVTFSANEVKNAESEVLVALGQEVSAEGFRKGKVPEEIVRQKVGAEKIQEEVAHKLLPGAMQKISEENELKPIIRPRVELASTEPFVMKITIVQQPDVKVKGAGKLTVKKHKIEDVVEEIKKGKKEDKGEDKKTEEQKKEEEKQWKTYAERQERERREKELFDLIAEKTVVEIVEELLDDEARVMLEEHMERLKQSGMEMEDWLKQVGKTFEVFFGEVRTAAGKRLKIRFGVQRLIRKWDITVDEDEMKQSIETFLSQVPEEYRAQLAPLYEKGAQNYEQFRSSKLVEKLTGKMLGEK